MPIVCVHHLPENIIRVDLTAGYSYGGPRPTGGGGHRELPSQGVREMAGENSFLKLPGKINK